MSTYTDNNILFTDVSNSGLKFPSGPFLISGVYDESLPELKKRASNMFAVRAIDIDWNGCKPDNNTTIKTTGDLIKWIKRSSSTPEISYKGYYSDGIKIGELTIAGTTITLYAPKTDGGGQGVSTIDNKDTIVEESRYNQDLFDSDDTSIEDNPANYVVGDAIQLKSTNIKTSDRISVVFKEAESIKIVSPSKIKLYENTQTGKTEVNISGTEVVGNTLYVVTPKKASSYTIEIGSGAVLLITSKQSNTNANTRQLTFSVVNTVNDAVKYLVMGLFNFNNPSTLSPAIDISKATYNSTVYVGQSAGNEYLSIEFKLKDGNIGLKFDNSDAVIEIARNPLPGIYVLGGDLTGLSITDQVRAIFTAYNNCKIKAIHFPGSESYLPLLWKVTNNGQHTYYGEYKEGYNSENPIHQEGVSYSNPNYGTLSSTFNYGFWLHDNYRYYTLYFNDGADIVVLQHMGRHNGLWRNVFVEYEESNRTPTSSDHVTYYKEFTVDFRSKSTGKFSSETSSDKCITISNMAHISGEYPNIKKNGSNSYLEITETNPISITCSRPSSKCAFTTDILSIEPLYNSETSNIECMENIAAGIYGETDMSSWKNNGNMNISYRGRDGFLHLEFKGNAKVYGLKIKYRTTYANSELVQETYPHPREYYTNPSNKVNNDLLFNYANISTIPSDATLNNNESVLNNMIIYNLTGNLYINPDLANLVWFYDVNKEGYSMDGSVTPIYTKLGHLQLTTYNNRTAVKVIWDKAVNMEVPFYDGQLQNWYRETEKFVVILPPYLIYSTINGVNYGNSEVTRFYYGFTKSLATLELYDRKYTFDFESPLSLNPAFREFTSTNASETHYLENDKTFTSDDGAVTIKFVGYHQGLSNSVPVLYNQRIINNSNHRYIEMPPITELEISIENGELDEISFNYNKKYLETGYNSDLSCGLGGLYMDKTDANADIGKQYYGGDFDINTTALGKASWICNGNKGIKFVKYYLGNHNAIIPNITVKYRTSLAATSFNSSDLDSVYAARNLGSGVDEEIIKSGYKIQYPLRIYVPDNVTINNINLMKDFSTINSYSGNNVSVVDGTRVPLFTWNLNEDSNTDYNIRTGSSRGALSKNEAREMWYYTGSSYTFGINPDLKVMLHQLTKVTGKVLVGNSGHYSYTHLVFTKPKFITLGTLVSGTFNRDSNYSNVGGIHIEWDNNLNDLVESGLYVVDISPGAFGDSNFARYVSGQSLNPRNCYVLKDLSQFYTVMIDVDLT